MESLNGTNRGDQTMPETNLQHTGRAEVSAPAPERGVTLTPRVDILETDDELLLYVDLPGVASENVDVRFENGELTLTGRRTGQYSGRPWLWEFEAGSFHRVFRVSDNAAGDKIHADLRDGVLTVHLPKMEAAKPRRIAVKAQ